MMDNVKNKIKPLTPEEVIDRMNKCIAQWIDEEIAQEELGTENSAESNSG